MAVDDLQKTASELMKKVLTVGVGAFFLTEESLRALVSEMKLPKELLGGILESARKSKDEFLKSLSQDVLAKISERVDPSAVLSEFFERNEVELKIKLNVNPKKNAKE